MNTHDVIHGLKHSMMLGALVLGIFAGSLMFPQPVGAVPFGGPVLSVVPPTPSPSGICPMHMVVSNFAAGGTLIGVYVMPDATLYTNYSIFTPMKFLLGEIGSVPNPSCTLPYQVLKLIQAGTS